MATANFKPPVVLDEYWVPRLNDWGDPVSLEEWAEEVAKALQKRGVDAYANVRSARGFWTLLDLYPNIENGAVPLLGYLIFYPGYYDRGNLDVVLNEDAEDTLYYNLIDEGLDEDEANKRAKEFLQDETDRILEAVYEVLKSGYADGYVVVGRGSNGEAAYKKVT